MYPAQYLMGRVNEAITNLLMVTLLRYLLIRTFHCPLVANGVPFNISKHDSVQTDNVKLMSTLLNNLDKASKQPVNNATTTTYHTEDPKIIARFQSMFMYA